MPSLSEIFDSGMAGWRGYTQGATLGLARYPAALAMVGMDKVAGNGKLDYTRALQEIREQDASDRQNNSGARTAGELVGTLANAVGTGGGGLGANVARGGIQGSVAGFTANEGMDNAVQDTALGGTLGSVMGGVGKGVQWAQNKLVSKAAIARQTRYLDEAKEALAKASTGTTPLAQALQKAGVTIDEATGVIRRISRTTRSAPKLGGEVLPKAAVEEAKVLARGVSAAAKIEKLAGGVPPAEVAKMARGPLWQELKGAGRGAVQTVKEVIPGVVTGGALGAGADVFMGNEQNPWQYAQLGAYGGGAARLVMSKNDLIGKTATAAAPWLPQGLGETAARAVTGLGVPAVSRANQELRAQAFEPVPWEAETEAPSVPSSAASSPAAGASAAPSSSDFEPVPWK
jgi:hypothetical protein